jgi:hypothetical protein
MIKHSPILFTLLISASAVAQISYEKGFYIGNDNKKIECLIKNVDWKNNPTRFEYKLPEATESKTEDISSVMEFGFDNSVKYLRSMVKIDRSSDSFDSLRSERNPTFRSEQLFLKVLVDGKATLLSYQAGTLLRFFYSVDKSDVQQLVYKKYLVENEGIATNSDFRQQLWMGFKCQDISENSIKDILYSAKALSNFFKKYNECHGETPSAVSSEKGDFFNFRLKAGLDYSTFRLIQPTNGGFGKSDFGNRTNFRVGIETEFILPFNKNKWAIIIEPTYQSYESANPVRTILGGATVKYRSIETPFGIRHYFFLNEKTKLFVNSFLIYDFVLDSRVKFSGGNYIDIISTFSFSAGGGLAYKKLSGELRYHFPHGVINEINFGSDYHKLSFIVGYKIF